MEDIIDKALSNRQLSEQSLNLYKRNLTKLNKNKPIKNFNFLKNKEEILGIIKDLKPTTQRSYIISVCSVLRDNSKYKKLYLEYFELLKQSNNDLKVNTDKSESQKENWVSSEEIDNIYETKKKDILDKIGNKRKIDSTLFDELTNFLILSLYTLIQPRRNKDYALMKLSHNKEDDNFNYVTMDKKTKKAMFILNKYKTDKKYHSVEIDIPNTLKEILILYLKFHPHRNQLQEPNYDFHLLVDKHGEPFKNSTEITKRLNKIFDKKISSSLLRNIYLTGKYSGVMEELQKDTKAMATSVSTAMNNYIKQD